MLHSDANLGSHDLPSRSVLRFDRAGNVLLFPSSVVVAALRSDGNLVLVRQYRSAAGQETIELPGGRIETGETPAKAGRREFTEETGLRCVSLKRLTCLDMDFSVSRHRTFVFTGQVASAANGRGSFDVTCVSLTRALSLIRNGSITHAPTVAAVLWLQMGRRAQP